ncbi:MAG: hypothetical protein IPK12_24985 [Gemmatimonadetes bacterium]|nr:hypothetical protein [Gemmatimonadota bacterium]
MPLPGSDVAVSEVELAAGTRATYGQPERLEILYCIDGQGFTDTETGDHHAVVAEARCGSPRRGPARFHRVPGMRVMRVVAPAVR